MSDDAAPIPAMPPRPMRPLSTLNLLRVGPKNSLALCDEELFEAPIVARRYVWGRFFSVSDPAGIHRIMTENVDNYPRIGPIRRVFSFGSGTGMLAAEGEVWRRHRRVLNPTMDHRAVMADLPLFAQFAAQLSQALAEIPAGEPVNIGETFTHLITAATGAVFAADAPEFGPALYRLGQYPGRYSLFDFIASPRWLGFLRPPQTARDAIADIAAMIDRLAAARRAPGYAGAHDLLWRVASAADPQTGAALDADELRDEVLTLGATAATPLRVFPWLLYLLALYPDAEARLHAELDAALGGRAPEAGDIPRLPYLRQIVDETLRLYPPAPTMLRTAAEDDEVCGHHLPRGSVVGVLPWVIHRHRALWDEPDRFDPERFAPEAVAARSRYAYLPFAIGPRVCIGASLALIEIITAMAVIAQRFRFRLAPGYPVAPIAWTNLHPKGGIWMNVERRRE
jgi:cytochrome P450